MKKLLFTFLMLTIAAAHAVTMPVARDISYDTNNLVTATNKITFVNGLGSSSVPSISTDVVRLTELWSSTNVLGSRVINLENQTNFWNQAVTNITGSTHITAIRSGAIYTLSITSSSPLTALGINNGAALTNIPTSALTGTLGTSLFGNLTVPLASFVTNGASTGATPTWSGGTVSWGVPSGNDPNNITNIVLGAGLGWMAFDTTTGRVRTLSTNNVIPWAAMSGAGAAGGDLTGTYPNPTVAALAITDAKVAAANKDGTAGTPSLRTLGTGSTQAAAGNDSRFTDSRAPTGAAGGALSGTYPNPGLATVAIASGTDNNAGSLTNFPGNVVLTNGTFGLSGNYTINNTGSLLIANKFDSSSSYLKFGSTNVLDWANTGLLKKDGSTSVNWGTSLLSGGWSNSGAFYVSGLLTAANGFTAAGTITLPSASISTSALKSDVVLTNRAHLVSGPITISGNGDFSADRTIGFDGSVTFNASGATNVPFTSLTGTLPYVDLTTAQTAAGNKNLTGTLTSTNSSSLLKNVEYRLTNLLSQSTVTLDFSQEAIQKISVTNNITFASTNLPTTTATARSFSLHLIADTSSRTLTWPGTWVAYGTALPTTLTANKSAWFTLTADGTNDAAVSVSFAAQP